MYVAGPVERGPLTLNIGLRLDHIRGHSPVLNEDVYEPELSVGPRIGVAYDLTGKERWSRRRSRADIRRAATGSTHRRPPGQDMTYTPINPDGSLGTPEVVTPGIIYGIGPDIGHPRTDEFNVSFEAQLTRPSGSPPRESGGKPATSSTT